MFGFLSPRPHSSTYRHAYARVCVHLRRNFGLRALPFHSYEAVFLYQLLLDAGAFPASVMPAVRCCKLAQPGNLSAAADAVHGRHAAALAVLLADIKLQDDIADSRSWLARGVRFVLKNRIRQARRHFRQLDPAFELILNGYLTAHAKLEKHAEPIPLADYVQPTAEAFGYVFGLAARLPGLVGQANALTEIGRGVGAALIAFDCAVDWQRDRARGEFNPLPDEAAVWGALHFAGDKLDAVTNLCRKSFGFLATSAKTATSVADRIASLNPLLGPSCPTTPLWRQALVVFTPKPSLALAGGPKLSLEPVEGEVPWQPSGSDQSKSNRIANSDPTSGKSSSGGSCGNCNCHSRNCDCSGCDCGVGDCGGCDCSC